MQYYYCNSAVVIFICTIYLFYVKKRIVDSQSRFFEIILWTGLFSTIFDILSEVAINNIEKYPMWLMYFVFYCYFISQTILPFLSTLYELELIDKMRSLKIYEKIRLYVPIIIVGLIILSNNWTKLIFYIDENNVYHHGNGFMFLYYQAGFYLALNVLYILNYRKIIKKNIRFMFAILSTAFMFIILLDFYSNQVMIQSFSISICVLLLFVIIQNSEEELEDFTGLLNSHALFKHTQIDYINQNSFTIILIKLEDKAIINFTIGTNYWFSLLNEVSEYLKSLDGLQDVYNIEDGLFGIKFRYDLPLEKKEHLMESITSKFALSKWSVLNRNLSISIKMLEISYPMDIDDISDIFYYIKYFNENTINSKSMLLKISDLSIERKNIETEKKKKLMDILDSFQYELCFMPVFSVSKDKVIAREPLLKLSTDPPIYVSPCELDHETEDSRKLKEIHFKIFEEICIYIKNNLNNIENNEFISINVAINQLMQEGLLEQYSSIIRKYEFDYRILGIELSEVVDYYEQPVICHNIELMNKYEMPFVLDNFGTGHSHFEHFKYIPFKYVKLDKYFIKKSVENEKGISILKSIIAMMNSLNIIIIADGVDTKEIADILISLGIDHLQGSYYIYK